MSRFFHLMSYVSQESRNVSHSVKVGKKIFKYLFRLSFYTMKSKFRMHIKMSRKNKMSINEYASFSFRLDGFLLFPQLFANIQHLYNGKISLKCHRHPSIYLISDEEEVSSALVFSERNEPGPFLAANWSLTRCIVCGGRMKPRKNV